MSRYRSVLLAAFVFIAGGIAVAVAQQAGGTKVGVLTCKTSASLGVIIGSHQKLACSFSPGDGGPSDYYTGHVTRI